MDIPMMVVTKSENPKSFNFLNQRAKILTEVCSNQPSMSKSAYKVPAAALNRMRQHGAWRPVEALDTVRAIIQRSVNAELNAVLQRYMDEFMEPALTNIRSNGQAVPPEAMDLIKVHILEEAKKMYIKAQQQGTGPSTSAADGAAASTSSLNNKSGDHHPSSSNLESKLNKISVLTLPGANPNGLGETSDAESDVSITLAPRQRKRPKHLAEMERPSSRSSTPGGSRPLDLSIQDLPKYVSDAEDKAWMFESGVKKAKAVGRAFLLFLEDVQILADSEEYCNNPAVNYEEIVGFAVPTFIQQKIKEKMQAVYEIQKYKLDT